MPSLKDTLDATVAPLRAMGGIHEITAAVIVGALMAYSSYDPAAVDPQPVAEAPVEDPLGEAEANPRRDGAPIEHEQSAG